MFSDSQPRRLQSKSGARTARMTSACLLILMWVTSVEAAFRKEASVSLGAEYDSNVVLDESERNNLGYVLGGRVGLTQNSARFDSQLRLDLERHLNSDISDETRPTGFLSGRMTLVRNRLFWTLNDTFSQVRVDPLGAYILDNTTNTNTLSTGPDWLIPFTAATELRVSARHERVDYEGAARTDRTRDNASAFLSHAFSPRWSVTLSHTRLWESFETTDRELATNKVGLNHNGKRLSWSVSAGRSNLASGLLSADVRDASVRYRITDNASAFATYSLSLDSDIGGALAFTGQRLENVRFLAGECVRGLGGVRGRCEDLPGVSALPVSDLYWVYRRDSLPGYLSEESLINSYLNDFSFDSALSESEAYTVGVQFKLRQVAIVLSFREDEQRESFEEATGSLFTRPDIIKTQSSELTVGMPITGRLRAQVGVMHRLPRFEQLLVTRESEERRVSSSLTWTIEPRFYASLSASLNEYSSDTSGDTSSVDNQNYALSFRYQLQ